MAVIDSGSEKRRPRFTKLVTSAMKICCVMFHQLSPKESNMPPAYAGQRISHRSAHCLLAVESDDRQLTRKVSTFWQAAYITLPNAIDSAAPANP